MENNVSIVPVQVAVYLDAAILPCSPREMFCCAVANDAPEHILDIIECLPNQRYCNIKEHEKH